MGQEKNLSVVHRCYVPHSAVHYADNLVDGAYSLALFGDVATHLSILHDAHEGLFAGYSSIDFLAPVRGGDVLEIEARLVKCGNRSRTLEFEARVVCRAAGANGAATTVEPPEAVTRAAGTVVVPRGYKALA